VIALAVTAGVVVAAGTAQARPVNPSDGQIGAAQQAAAAAAAQVAQLQGQVAAAQAAVSKAQGEANIALDRYEGQQQQYQAAQAAEAAAEEAEQWAVQQLDTARAQVADFARDSYISGSTSSRMTGLLTSGSPTQMLERAALLDAAGDRRSTVLDAMGAAEQQASAAAATAKAALARAAQLKQAAAATLATAEREEALARQQAGALQTQQTQLQAQLSADQQQLATLQGQRAAALAYDAQISAGVPRAIGRTTAGAPSQGAVATAIAAAERWVGTRYAWGGGSLTGPSMGWGIDDGVVGFDCSGLTRYAYAQAGIGIPRQSTQQYAALPKVSSSDLQPGDLVFYAFDTSDPSTIHHVAMYLGGGRMIEAPESGERVHVTAMRWGGFIGAARPSG
jgi:cell wall-associated NlpC family hydrolase